MELPSRARGQILLPSGEMTDIRRRLRLLAAKNDLTTVIACAFDHRTRILPFIYADLAMIPAGVRAIGAAMHDSGFRKTRIVLQQWNKNFSPTEMRLDGRLPDIFMVSTMSIHSGECERLVREANLIEPARRPLIMVGGPQMFYEPWQAFKTDPGRCADVAVTGEEYVLLSFLEVLLSLRAEGESMRSVFQRARDSGALDAIPGLVYSRSTTPEGPPEELVDTGIQQLLGDLDELPHPVTGYKLMEPPGRHANLSRRAMRPREIHRHCKISSIVLTIGCKFRCQYCPIPAYNQRQYRVKSGERIADEMGQISNKYGIDMFFGTDDNFFNDTDRTLDIAEALAKRSGTRPYCRIRYATEATVHDTIRIQEHLPLIRKSGLCAVWMGVEDLTGTLVKKGQSESKTLESFHLLRQNGIYPIPMMMHHDSQPLVTFKNNYGIANQLGILRKAGALYTQVLMIGPSPGSKWFEQTYESGMVFESVNGVPVEEWIRDGSYLVASNHPRPWIKQINLLLAYTYFFNPLRFLLSLIWSKSYVPYAADERRPAADVAKYSPWKKFTRWLFCQARAQFIDGAMQIVGMAGLFHTYRRTLGWAWQLFRGNIKRYQSHPVSVLPMRDPFGGPASHAIPGTPAPHQKPADTKPIVELPMVIEVACGKAA